MPESKVYSRGRAQVAFNMIDCTFQLIIFFILSTTMASQDYVRMSLPDPDNTVAKDYEGLDKVVVNVVPYPAEKVKADSSLLGMAMEYRLGVGRFSKNDIGRLVRQLTHRRRERESESTPGKTGEFVVELRADRGVHYTEIEPVLQALQQARLGSMYITAERAKHGS